MNNKIRLSLWLLVNLLIITLSIYLATAFINYKDYTLMQDGRWESSKTKLAKGVMGAWATMFTKVALSENHLNLSVWHGYQELIYKQPINLTGIGFKYQAGSNPFSFIIDKTDSSSAGIYFHYFNDSTCCLFTTDGEGKFLSKRMFPLRNEYTDSGSLNFFYLVRMGDAIRLFINRKIVFEGHFPTAAFVRPGFKGGSKPVWVTDIKASDNNRGQLISEDFSAPFKFSPFAILVALILAMPFLFIAFYRENAASVTLLNVVICVGVAFGYYYYFFYSSKNYPTGPDDVNWHGATTDIEWETDVCERLNRDYPVEKFAVVKPVILFIGSSQTWGAGVTKSGKTMPCLVEQNLRNYFNDTAITVINTGISGLTSDRLYQHYLKEWSKYKPLITVINLSTNDQDTAVFRAHIRKFIEYDTSQNIQTILVDEPNDFMSGHLQNNHAIVESEGARYGIRVIKMQSFLDRYNESGFLWWDEFHLTDYGHHLFAERVSPDIIEVLEKDGLLHKNEK